MKFLVPFLFDRVTLPVFTNGTHINVVLQPNIILWAVLGYSGGDVPNWEPATSRVLTFTYLDNACETTSSQDSYIFGSYFPSFPASS